MSKFVSFPSFSFPTLTARDISTRIHSCETENAMLKSDNASLIQQVKNLNTIKAQLEKELSRY
jgi:hypothetical protein